MLRSFKSCCVCFFEDPETKNIKKLMENIKSIEGCIAAFSALNNVTSLPGFSYNPALHDKLILKVGGLPLRLKNAVLTLSKNLNIDTPDEKPLSELSTEFIAKEYHLLSSLEKLVPSETYAKFYKGVVRQQMPIQLSDPFALASQ